MAEKLSRDDVLAIFDRVLDGQPNGEIAETFGIDPRTVSAIKTGYIWNSVTGLPKTRVYK